MCMHGGSCCTSCLFSLPDFVSLSVSGSLSVPDLAIDSHLNSNPACGVGSAVAIMSGVGTQSRSHTTCHPCQQALVASGIGIASPAGMGCVDKCSGAVIQPVLQVLLAGGCPCPIAWGGPWLHLEFPGMGKVGSFCLVPQAAMSEPGWKD